MDALYRHYDENGILLYVGVSLNAIARLAQHAGKPWFARIKRVEVEPFESREAALRAEAAAIATEKPEFNRRGGPHRAPPKARSMIYMPPAMKQKLKEIAGDEGRSENAMWNDAIYDWLAKKGHFNVG